MHVLAGFKAVINNIKERHHEVKLLNSQQPGSRDREEKSGTKTHPFMSFWNDPSLLNKPYLPTAQSVNELIYELIH